MRVMERVDLEALRESVESAGAGLARARAISARTRAIVRRIAEEVLAAAGATVRDRDPYLVVGLQSGAVASLLAAEASDRARLRVGLEQIRQALRDLIDEAPAAEDRPAAEVARWLAGALDVPQAEIARLVGTSPRTFQRWIAEGEEVEPRSDDARRLRIVARVAAHLRHALTGPGVLRWFTAAHPALAGRAPAELLDDADAAEALTRLAASVRSSAAA